MAEDKLIKMPDASKLPAIDFKSMLELKSDLMEKLKVKLAGDFEVALSIASGSGKEHMALISALLSIPVGIRLVVYTKEGVQVIN